MKNCPSGFMCFEKYLIFFILFFISVIFLIYISNQRIVINNNPSEKIFVKNIQRENIPWGGFFPSWPYNNSDTLLNPYAPPLRDERYFIPRLNQIPPGALPINISTNVGAVDSYYRQIGILTPINGTTKDNILPLLGRPLFTNRDKWQYYSTSNQHNNVKLPVCRGRRSCTNEYGCDKLYTNDSVFVEGANETYKVTVYDNDTIKYLPFL